MTPEALSEIQREQKRQSDELSAMRAMHTELMRGVHELCSQLKVLEVQYREAINRQSEMFGQLKEHGAKIEEMRIAQASNEYFISLVKSINRNVMFAMFAAVAGGGTTIAAIMGKIS